MNELIGQGRTSDIFRYDEYRVIKVFKKELSHLAEFEYECAKAIDNIGITAPRVYEIKDIDGTKGIVYDYVQGISMLSSMQKAPLKIKQYAKQLANIHAELHSKQVANLPKIKESLAFDIQSVNSINKKDKRAILNYLETLPNGDRLCHYDFHPGNVMIFDGDTKVIDWMTAGIGDPCADVCRTGLILNSNAQPYGSSIIERAGLSIFRKIFYRSYIRQYLKITNTKMKQIERWLLPVAAARLNEGIESELPYLNAIISKKLSQSES